MLQRLSAMPGGVRLFLAYGFLILTIVGAALPAVINLAVDAPITFPGVVVTVLLAWIFLRELLAAHQWTGVAIILGGILLVSL